MAAHDAPTEIPGGQPHLHNQQSVSLEACSVGGSAGGRGGGTGLAAIVRRIVHVSAAAPPTNVTVRSKPSKHDCRGRHDSEQQRPQQQQTQREQPPGLEPEQQAAGGSTSAAQPVPTPDGVQVPPPLAVDASAAAAAVPDASAQAGPGSRAIGAGAAAAGRGEGSAGNAAEPGSSLGRRDTPQAAAGEGGSSAVASRPDAAPGNAEPAHAGGQQASLPCAAGEGGPARRVRWPLGVSCGRWSGGLHKVRCYVPLDANGRPSAGADRKEVFVGKFDRVEEAAFARDLALMWRQLALGQPLEGGNEKYNYRPASLHPHAALLTERQPCATLKDLQAQLQQLASSGRLQKIAAASAPVAANCASEAAARALESKPSKRSASAAGGSHAPRMRQKRRRERGTQEGDEQAPLLHHFKPEPEEHTQHAQQARQQVSRRVHGWAAEVGRRLRVWLALDGGPTQQHEGRVVERTPSGKNHVLFDDGEEALLDLGQACFEFTSPPPAHTAPTTAAADVSLPAAAADVGQHLRVWWPDEWGSGAWYHCHVTHVLRNGMHCVLYGDGSELLLDTSDPQQRVRWADPQRQRAHELALRQAQQQQQQQDGHSAPAALQSAAAAAAAQAGGDEPKVLLLLVDAVALPEAAAAGLSEDLIGAFAAVLDRFSTEDQARMERRLRLLLSKGQHSAAAAMMRTAVQLELKRAGVA